MGHGILFLVLLLIHFQLATKMNFFNQLQFATNAAFSLAYALSSPVSGKIIANPNPAVQSVYQAANSEQIESVPSAPSHTNLLSYWCPNYDPTYLWSEVWHSSDLVHWRIYPQCAYTNYLVVPMNNWITNTISLYDTNGNFLGLQTNILEGDFFFSVDVEMWNVRITNYTWTETL